MGVFAASAGAPEVGHEQVVFCHDRASGLRAIIAIYSTALGPSLGGTRFYPYPDEDAALHDVLELSKGMAYKNALAGLDHGGGKAVIWGDPVRDKSEALLRAYGRFVQSLGGRYYTACDVGTYVEDMDVVARESRFVTGRSPEHGGAGDSSVLTAYGVFQAMRAAAAHRWGSDSLAGKRVGVSGVGKVGRHLVEHLLADGASVLVADVNPSAVEAVRARFGQVEAVGVDALVGTEMDLFSPCALGGALDDETVPALRAEIVCGAANNQLAHPGLDKVLADRGVLYTPDYVVNSGGVIQVADEIRGFVFERAKRRAARIHDTTRQILQLADAEGVTPTVSADRLAERRMSDVGRLRAIHLPSDR
ncbi:MAG TPA: Glu/Leu/Phe/Val dehydrogenase dimerization domain-containing protein [Cryptosporangiaceae bacterium]|nr:Glu/Leu/Phe/Val dehydrogenase dimerization domain-containing protein [Cryptosporangiaceae bacterium]